VRLFFDTNVLLDVLTRREPFHADSAKLWALVEAGKVSGSACAISFSNMYYVVRNLSGSRAAYRGLQLVSALFDIIPCDERIIQQAIDANLADFDDAIQFFSAVRANADYIITRDSAHFAKSHIPVAAPPEFLAGYGQQ
jgi:predicted nucleic acid-binding protein